MTSASNERLDFLKNLTRDERNRFFNMSKEEQAKCITENMLSKQDDAMWARNEGISQLEHRINTNSFQG